MNNIAEEYPPDMWEQFGIAECRNCQDPWLEDQLKNMLCPNCRCTECGDELLELSRHADQCVSCKALFRYDYSTYKRVFVGYPVDIRVLTKAINKVLGREINP